MLRTSLRSLVALFVLSSAVHAQIAGQGTCTVRGVFAGSMHLAELEVTGPPNSFFDVFYAVDLQGTGLGLLHSGNLGASGIWTLTVPLQGNLQVPTLWVAAIIDPPGPLPPVVAGPCAVAAAAAVAPCVPSGAMTWDPTTCTVILSAKVCPGDVVDIVVNGVSVLTGGPAGANGRVVMAHGGLCPLPAGSTISATRNGAPWLGPLTP
jgi:hypothetical protein